MKRLLGRILLSLTVATFLLCPLPLPGQTKVAVEEHAPRGYEATPALIDLRTTFSDGAYDPETLVAIAAGKGFRVLIFTDHDRMAMEYGLPPFRNIVKKRVELNAINRRGAAAYLQAIRDIQAKRPDMVLLPGTISAPFYYWTGSPLAGDLTAHDHERRLLTVGLERPEDIETLPVLHNVTLKDQLRAAWPALAAFALVALIGLPFLFQRGIWRLAGILLTMLGAALFFNTLFARPSPYNPYQGPQGVAPYQRFIDEVSARGGLTFWNYPETRSGVRRLGPIRVSTPPYPQMLSEARDYTGFAAVYGDTATVTEPGNLWDLVLREYCAGFRRRPAWGIATSDYHSEGESGERLGNFQTVLWLSERSPAAVLEALGKGRMYAARGRFPRVPRLEAFSVAAAHTDAPRAISGEEIALTGPPRIRIALTALGADGRGRSVRVRLIRSGTLIHTVQGPLPLAIDHTDAQAPAGEKIYYRMDMTGEGRIVSNPIFVTRIKESPDAPALVSPTPAARK